MVGGSAGQKCLLGDRADLVAGAGDTPQPDGGGFVTTPVVARSVQVLVVALLVCLGIKALAEAVDAVLPLMCTALFVAGVAGLLFGGRRR